MKHGLVRIIAGKWRSRRIKIADVKNLRPTPDRVRETLFNWLAPLIEGAYCLDLFAGSGILGFESLSRGAKQVVMVDQSLAVVKLLQDELTQFGAENGAVLRAKIPKQLPLATHPFDIVFVDPPYSENLLLPTCHYLEEQNYLAQTAHLYLEAGKPIEDNELPLNWHIIKKEKAGNVFYHLVRRELKSL